MRPPRRVNQSCEKNCISGVVGGLTVDFRLGFVTIVGENRPKAPGPAAESQIVD